MEAKTTYITKDGYEFDDKEMAIDHEIKITKMENDSKLPISVNGKTLYHDDIVAYFNSLSCSDCPFKKECENLERVNRMYRAYYSVCDVINNKVEYIR